MNKLYYTPPKQEIFDEVKEKAIELWETYDNTHGYVDEKVGRIKDLENVGDNVMYIIGMFDQSNQRILFSSLTELTRYAINDRIIDGGGNPIEL